MTPTTESRLGAIEATQKAHDTQVQTIRDDLKRLEGRLYAIVATGILASGAMSSLFTH